MIIALLILFGILDLYTTYRGLKQGDTEANPVAKVFSKIFGNLGLLLLKALTTSVLVGILALRPNWWPVGALALLGYGYVLWHNISVLQEE
jgi:hypothetical protein